MCRQLSRRVCRRFQATSRHPLANIHGLASPICLLKRHSNHCMEESRIWLDAKFVYILCKIILRYKNDSRMCYTQAWAYSHLVPHFVAQRRSVFVVLVISPLIFIMHSRSTGSSPLVPLVIYYFSV